MNRLLLFSLLLLAPLLAAACDPPREAAKTTNAANAANAPAASPPGSAAKAGASPAAATANAAEVVTASAAAVELRAGGAGEASVRLRIAEGYHVNANPPSDKFYIGTRLTVAPQAGVEPGEPAYPAALDKKFAFAAKPLAVYEGEAVIRLPLRAGPSAAKGRRDLDATVRVQPCNDQACLQPRDIKTTIPVTVN